MRSELKLFLITQRAIKSDLRLAKSIDDRARVYQCLDANFQDRNLTPPQCHAYLQKIETAPSTGICSNVCDAPAGHISLLSYVASPPSRRTQRTTQPMVFGQRISRNRRFCVQGA